MPSKTDPGRSLPAFARRSRLMLFALIALNGLIEAVLWGSDQGFWGHANWRALTYAYGAVWPGMLHLPGTDLWPGQHFGMFVTHAFIHTGPGHLMGNMATALFVGLWLSQDLGPRTLLGLYLASAISGGIGFVLLTPTWTPMVGASGAVTGMLAAAILGTGLRTDPAEGRNALWMVIFLIAANVAIWLGLEGAIAWQAHLGGAMGGAAFVLAQLLWTRAKMRA